MEEKKEPMQEIKEPSLPELIDKLQKANLEAKENLNKYQELIAKNLIGGNTDSTPKQEKKEETPQEYAQRILRGG